MGQWRSVEPAPALAAVARAPDYGEPVRAWRLWEVAYFEGIPRLRSLYRNCFWPIRTRFDARCEAHKFRLWRQAKHAAPTETCTCGVYGVPFESIRKFTVHDGLPPGRSLAIGTVSLWGDVVECERGWRAAFAYPSFLFMPLVCADARAKAAGLKDYGVPVELLDTNGVDRTLYEVETAA
jgi:hypothetical protein